MPHDWLVGSSVPELCIKFIPAMACRGGKTSAALFPATASYTCSFQGADTISQAKKKIYFLLLCTRQLKTKGEKRLKGQKLSTGNVFQTICAAYRVFTENLAHSYRALRHRFTASTYCSPAPAKRPPPWTVKARGRNSVFRSQKHWMITKAHTQNSQQRKPCLKWRGSDRELWTKPCMRCTCRFHSSVLVPGLCPFRAGGGTTRAIPG